MAKISLTSDAVVFYYGNNGVEIVLIKRKNEPFQGKWALPGGFLETDETCVEGCVRELKEETGLLLSSKQFTQVGVYDAINRDPRGRMISIAFAVLLSEKLMIKGADDAADAQWKPFNQLDELAFDHIQIIQDAVKVLQIQA